MQAFLVIGDIGTVQNPGWGLRTWVIYRTTFEVIEEII
jgi:hypothetical protein